MMNQSAIPFGERFTLARGQKSLTRLADKNADRFAAADAGHSLYAHKVSCDLTALATCTEHVA
ncbi:hypothetical protein NDK50_21280 [Paraburkholderia bryophila]|uniref:hypothetical protein n=1 Tax=Paraburkholderia bryophila TaxID=420952 RepID=UPI00234B305C|nr:hypothetical protein [Paraburkholderia bryophila]WCM23408.1 hypothetical protein NDK50_21280 [Paraburkholderia bryophila]